MTTAHAIQVLIVDDSAAARQALAALLGKAHDIQVMGQAADPLSAMARMEQQWPDVILLDVEMHRMDGITWLRKLMTEHPTPVILCSSLTEKAAETTLQALGAGAFAIFTKPALGVDNDLGEVSEDLVSAVRAAAGARMATLPGAKLSADAVLAPGSSTPETFTAIGTSTGGTQALEFVLSALPRTCPGLVVVQHLPEKFTAAFAARLNSLCEIEVREAATGDCVLPGQALIAPGGRHMLVKWNGARYAVEILSAPPVNRHCPSVDVLFRSAAKYGGRNARGVLMTGMGNDGARGLLEMRQAGAQTIAQDEESCVVFGMPKEAIKLGGAERVVPLRDIPGLIAT